MYWDDATIEKIRRGYYSAVYFNRTKKILEQEHDKTVVTMQVFQWNDRSTLCGINDAANGKPVFFFADRFDDFSNQEGDGYAAHVGGAAGVCTLAHASRWKGIPIGTIPHALIAVSGGDTTRATKRFVQHITGVNVIALVDFDNDCVGTSLAVARALGKKLWGVRLDTAGDMIDVSVSSPGVNPTLVRLVRRALHDNGFAHVKILVSGGFTEEKVRMFEKEKAPVDGYGVGSALVHGSNDFTADVVKVNGKKIAKSGRVYTPSKRLRLVKMEKND